MTGGVLTKGGFTKAGGNPGIDVIGGGGRFAGGGVGVGMAGSLPVARRSSSNMEGGSCEVAGDWAAGGS